jgi:hypothetical protein
VATALTLKKSTLDVFLVNNILRRRLLLHCSVGLRNVGNLIPGAEGVGGVRGSHKKLFFRLTRNTERYNIAGLLICVIFQKAQHSEFYEIIEDHIYNHTLVQNIWLEDLLFPFQFCEWLLQEHDANSIL